MQVSPGSRRMACLFALIGTLFFVGVEASVRDVDDLYYQLRSRLDPKVPPTLKLNSTVAINIEFRLVSVVGLDEKTGEISILAGLAVDWLEERAVNWNPQQELEGKASYLITAGDVWTPRLFLINPSQNVKDLTKTAKRIRLSFNGTMRWDIVSAIKASCSVDITHYPFDTQTCSIHLAPWGMETSEVQLHGTIAPTKESTIPNSGWELSKTKIRSDIVGSLPFVTVTIQVVRHSSYFLVNVVIPSGLLGFMNPIVFLLPVESGERASFSITCFLAFTVFMALLNDNIPDTSSPLPTMSYFNISIVSCSACIMMATIISLRIYHKHGHDPVYSWVKVWVRLMRLRYCLKSPPARPTPTDYHGSHADSTDDVVREEEDIVVSETYRKSAFSTPAPAEDEITWITVSVTLDIVFFVAFLAWYLATIISYMISIRLNIQSISSYLA